jgi:hypothetical protein
VPWLGDHRRRTPTRHRPTRRCPPTGGRASRPCHRPGRHRQHQRLARRFQHTHDRSRYNDIGEQQAHKALTSYGGEQYLLPMADGSGARLINSSSACCRARAMTARTRAECRPPPAPSCSACLVDYGLRPRSAQLAPDQPPGRDDPQAIEVPRAAKGSVRFFLFVEGSSRLGGARQRPHSDRRPERL